MGQHGGAARSIPGPASLVRPSDDCPGVRNRTHVPQLVGLITERIVWIRPSSTSSVQMLSTLLSRSRKIAPGWPFTSCGSTTPPIRANAETIAASIRATFSAPAIALPHCGALPPLSPTSATSAASSSRRPSTSPSRRHRRSAPPAHPAPCGPPRTGAVLRPCGAAPGRELTACRLRPAYRRRDLGEAEPEDLPQHEDRPLEWAQPLEQQQGRHRQGVGQPAARSGSS